ncbi:hypothetical protein [Polyangium jinanense]|uniref:Outer membrane beta-barrel porin/alpha-amylase n=1 Tax=Polyangium jinanense TaxID=2829994 RepID=A0A9X3XCN9_9BACT|nr:hypothetical protein [Polyangium jinanense]MDC3986905.1 hypothetical protein [Polyangium jinanense]
MRTLLRGLTALLLLSLSLPARADVADEPRRKDDAPEASDKPALDKPAPDKPAETKPAEAPAPPDERRPRSLDLSVFYVPWGMHYTRSAIGATLGYKIPLVQKKGVLWDSTNVTVGVRDVYGFVNNTVGPFIDITPIAFFRLQVQGAFDYFIKEPFNGGMRVMTPLGRERLAAGQIRRGRLTAVDWVNQEDGEGMDNPAHFRPAINHGGFRLRVLPTLQGKVGPIAFQYNFTGDWNYYTAPGADADDVYHDNFTFTLRKLQDFSHAHEVLVAYTAPVPKPGELMLGLSGRYQRVLGTGLEQLTLHAVAFGRWPKKFLSDRMSPFAIAQLGTNLIDPMWQYAFSWILVVGADFNLHKSKT